MKHVFVAAVLTSGLMSSSAWALFETNKADYTVVLVMNNDQFKGKWKQFKGDLKKKWGEFTDDDLLEIEGNYDKFQGIVQERYGDRKQDVQRWTDDWFKKHSASKRK